jgi:hypothetical protein
MSCRWSPQRLCFSNCVLSTQIPCRDILVQAYRVHTLLRKDPLYPPTGSSHGPSISPPGKPQVPDESS